MTDLIAVLLTNIRNADIHIPMMTANGTTLPIKGTITFDWTEDDELVLNVEPDKTDLHIMAERRLKRKPTSQ